MLCGKEREVFLQNLKKTHLGREIGVFVWKEKILEMMKIYSSFGLCIIERLVKKGFADGIQNLSYDKGAGNFFHRKKKLGHSFIHVDPNRYKGFWSSRSSYIEGELVFFFHHPRTLKFERRDLNE